MRRYKAGNLAGLEIVFTASSVVASILLWAVLSALGWWLLALGPIAAIVGGFIAVILHWLSEFAHQLGHAWAARRVGHPMKGIRLWLLLGVSRYPRDEGELPADVHIRRALGGAPVSLVLAIVGGVVALLLQDSGSLWYWLALFFGLENFLVFTLGAFVPLGFTDGSTLLEWWPKR